MSKQITQKRNLTGDDLFAFINDEIGVVDRMVVTSYNQHSQRSCLSLVDILPWDSR
jgi:hypothetical protein